MTECERLSLKPCNTCNGGQSLVCYVIAYKMMINTNGFESQLKHVLEHLENAPYLLTAVRLYYPEYIDRTEKLMVLL